jgi:DNA-directed RNA polymerase specialized sigma24 family protein
MVDDRDLPELLMTWLAEVAGDGIDLQAEVDRRVRDLLTRWISRSVSGIDASELSDIADEALLRAYLAIQKGRLDVTRPDAPGYVLTTARRIAYDRYTRDRSTPVDPDDLSQAARAEPAYGDEAIVALVERSADLATIQAAVRRAIDAHQLVTVRVVATWLDLASLTGERPSFRDVAQKVGLSHTAVRKHWARFREHLLAVQQEAAG